MQDKKEKLNNELVALEAEMNSADFWSNKDRAQAVIKRIQELKTEIEGGESMTLGGHT